MGYIEAAGIATVCTFTLTALGATIAAFAPRVTVLGQEARLIIDAVIAMLISSLLAMEIMTRLMPCRALSGSIEAAEVAISIWTGHFASLSTQAVPATKEDDALTLTNIAIETLKARHIRYTCGPPPTQSSAGADHLSSLCLHWIDSMFRLQNLGAQSDSIDAYRLTMLLVVVVAHLFENPNSASDTFWEIFVSRIVVVFVHVTFMTLARMANRESLWLADFYARWKLDTIHKSINKLC